MTQGFGRLRSAAESALAFSWSSGSRISSASRLPSGDHSNPLTPCFTSVSFCASPPRRSSTQTCVSPPLREERKPSQRPSGLHCGFEDETPSAVSGSASPPAAGAIQMRVSLRSCFSSTVVTV